MVQEGFGIYTGRVDRDKNGNPIYITGVNGSGWLNVFALKRRDGKTYYRFGYNVNEERWAYGLRPQIDEEILNRKRKVASPTCTSAGPGRRFLRGTMAVIGRIILFAAQAVVERQRLRSLIYVGLVVLFLVSHPLGQLLTGGPTVWIKPLACLVFLAAALYSVEHDLQEAQPSPVTDGGPLPQKLA